MGSPDYERWLREKQQSEAKLEDADDADIRAEEAHESKHRRRFYDSREGRWKEEVPLRHWTSGTWAQILIGGTYWAIAAVLIYATSFGPRDQSLKAFIWLASVVPSIIGAIVTWHAMGREMRDGLRGVVRLLPLLIIGLLIASAMINRNTPKDRSEKRRQDALGRVEARPPPATSVATPPANAPLAELEIDPGLKEIEAWWRQRTQCLGPLRSAVRVPGSGGQSLADGFACIRKSERRRDEIERFVDRHQTALLDRGRASGKPSDGLILALGHLHSASETVRILVAWGRSEESATNPALLEALTLASMRWPSELPKVLGSLSPDWGPAVTLLFASAWARTDSRRHDACLALAKLAVKEEDYSTSSFANARLGELAPLCSSLTSAILTEVRRLTKDKDTRDQKFSFAAHSGAKLLEHASLKDFAAIRALVHELDDRPDVQLVRGEMGRASEALIEREFERRVGLSPLVFGHPQTRALLDASTVHKGPCRAEDLGLDEVALKQLGWLPDCAEEVSVPDWIRAPLEPWRARLDGWDMSRYRQLDDTIQ